MNTFLSIIIPCYNVAPFLPKTLDSLCRLENAQDCEFICVNDGSIDNTPDIIQAYAEKDKRFVFLTQHNQGVSAARNNALDRTNGQYIYLLDGDDFLQPNAVNVIRENLKDADMLVSAYSLVDGETGKVIRNVPLPLQNGLYTIEDCFLNLTFFPTTPQIIYKASIIREYSLRFNPDIQCGEVWDFTVSVMQHADTVKFCSVCIYDYVMRGDSAVHYPRHEADLTTLLSLKRFRGMDTPWSRSTAFLLTAFRMVTSFTYNKYLKLHLIDKQTLNTLDRLFADTAFRQLMAEIQLRTIPIEYRLRIAYLRRMPHRLGYRIAIALHSVIKPFLK